MYGPFFCVRQQDAKMSTENLYEKLTSGNPPHPLNDCSVHGY